MPVTRHDWASSCCCTASCLAAAAARTPSTAATGLLIQLPHLSIMLSCCPFHGTKFSPDSFMAWDSAPLSSLQDIAVMRSSCNGFGACREIARTDVATADANNQQHVGSMSSCSDGMQPAQQPWRGHGCNSAQLQQNPTVWRNVMADRAEDQAAPESVGAGKCPVV